jgi:hypothetical protein
MTEKEYEALYEALEAAHKILPGAKECDADEKARDFRTRDERLPELRAGALREELQFAACRERTQRVRIGATGERAGLAREFGIAATDLRERAKRIRRRKGRAGDRARRRGSADLGFIGRWRSD